MKKYLKKLFIIPLFFVGILFFSGKVSAAATWVSGNTKYTCPESAPYRYQSRNQCYKSMGSAECPSGYTLNNSGICIKPEAPKRCKIGSAYSFNGDTVCAYNAVLSDPIEKKTGLFKKEYVCTGSNIVYTPKNKNEKCVSCPQGYEQITHIPHTSQSKCIFMGNGIYDKCPDGQVSGSGRECYSQTNPSCSSGQTKIGNYCYYFANASTTTDTNSRVTEACTKACSNKGHYNDIESCKSSCKNSCDSKCSGSVNDACASDCASKFSGSYKYDESNDVTTDPSTKNSDSSNSNLDSNPSNPTNETDSSIKVSSIVLSDKSVIIGEKQTYTLGSTISPENATNKTLKWISSDKSIVEVDENGKIVGKKKGTATITVSSTDEGGASSKCKVKVTKEKKTISLSITKSLEVKKGRKKTISVKFNPTDVGSKNIKWESSDASVAKVSNNGVVTGVKKGKATITATSKDGSKKSASCEVTVLNIEPLSFKKGSKSVRLEKEGKKFTLEYNADKGEEVVFESTNSLIATVSSKGVVTAKGIGTTTIIAYYKNNRTSSQIEAKIYVGNLIESIKPDSNNYSMKIGETKQAVVTLSPSNASVTKLRFVSSDSSIVTTNNSGVLKAIAPGTVTININSRDGSRKTSYIVVTVSEDGKGKADLTGLKGIKDVTLNKKTLKLEQGKSEKLTIEKNPSKIPSNKLQWFSRNEKIATVNKKGVVKAVGSGQTAVYLLYDAGGGVKKTVGFARIDVDYIRLKSITVKPSSKIMKKGETVQLSISKYTPINAVNTRVNWSSSNNKVATVNSKGLVTTVGNGSATIYAVAKDGSRTTNFSRITVNETGKADSKKSKDTKAEKDKKNKKDKNTTDSKKGKEVKATSIKISQSTVSIGAGQTTKLTVSFAPGNVTNKKLKWKSSNTSIATVDQNGIVKGLKKGRVTITASTTDGSKKSTTCTVNVVKKVLLTSISIDNKISLKTGKKKTLKVLYTPTNASKKSVKWTSSNIKVAVVNSKGVVTAKSAGKAVITATARDGSKKTATCTVTVKGKSKSSGSVNDKDYNKKHQDEEIIQKRIFIGDSRTEGMHNAVGSKSSDVWSAKTGEGYDWMVSTGVPAVENQIGKATAVIILMGVNDYAYNAKAETYSKYINEKAAVWVKKGAKVYFVSVNAVDDAKSQYAKNHSINAFNVKVKSLLSKNVTYIDTYNNINWNAVKFDDSGVHYDAATYKTIYNYILNKIYKVSNTKNGKNNKTKTIKVTNVSISGSNAVQVGKSITLNATVTPSNASNKSVTWASNNTKVATVSAAGTVRGKKAGTVTITATAKDGSKKKATFKVTVSKKAVKNNNNISKPTNNTTKKTTEEAVENKPINVSGFYTDVGITKTANYTTVYNDYWFSSKNPSTTNNKDLAALSMFASASVYNLPSAVALLQKCGFTAEQFSVANSSSDNDHVSFVVGYKKISNFTLVAIVVKGTSGDYEWVSNFNVGKETTHVGFKKAKDELANKINDYINKNNIKGTVKYWVTGHSRGAAVANLYANNLNKSVGANNVYAYTFATPRVSKAAMSSSNIFNYINSGDFVTEVAPKKWGFKRFGTDIVINSSELKSMKNNFKNYSGIEYEGFTENRKNEVLEKFIVYAGSSQEEYYKQKTYKRLGRSATFSAAEFCMQGVGCAIAGSTEAKDKVTNWGSLAIKASDFASYIYNKEGLKKEFAHAHCTSSYISWLTSLTSNSNVSYN